MNNSTAIHIENLSKTFGRGKKQVQALKNLNLEVERGQVFGFLGPNGAGKSTTIRILMDLIRPTQGRAFIFGQNVQKETYIHKRVGSLVEGASFYEFMSGRINLEVLTRTADSFNPENISALLKQVGLVDHAEKSVNGYSTGMKQRLGIAAALLGDPDLIILDEPTKGLDPAGMQEMRRFIRSLATEKGKTVFLSSHMLNEVEQVCDQVAIIHRGILIRAGHVSDLLSQEQSEIRVQVSSDSQASRALQDQWAIQEDSLDTAGKTWLKINADPDESPLIIQKLVAQDIAVHQVLIKHQSLEDYFLNVTQEDNAND